MNLHLGREVTGQCLAPDEAQQSQLTLSSLISVVGRIFSFTGTFSCGRKGSV